MRTAQLTNADLTDAKLIYARLIAVDLKGANLRGADLSGALIAQSQLNAACGSDAVLRGGLTKDLPQDQVTLKPCPSKSSP